MSNASSQIDLPARAPDDSQGALSRQAARSAARACKLLLAFNDLEQAVPADSIPDREAISARLMLLADAISAAREAMTLGLSRIARESAHCDLFTPKDSPKEPREAGARNSTAECAGDGHFECRTCAYHNGHHGKDSHGSEQRT